MKYIVTHTSPDLDAITAVWLIERFLPDWGDADVKFVQAGEKITGSAEIGKNWSLRSPCQFDESSNASVPPIRRSSDLGIRSDANRTLVKMSSHVEASRDHIIEIVSNDEYVHVDTGLGPLDHHQLEDENVCSASLVWEFIKTQNLEFRGQSSEKREVRKKAVERIVRVVTEIDHFREVFWENPTADYHEFILSELIEGLKQSRPDDDNYYLDFGMKALDALLRNFENRILAEKEIKESGIKFQTSFGEGIGFETLNDSVIKLAQKMGYVVVARKDPRKGYVRIKARPAARSLRPGQKDIDLTLAYEQLRKMDPGATWFLHISKKMLLNGTTKNPKMKPTKLSLSDIIKVLEKI